MQMTKIGIFYNSKRDFRRNRVWCMTIIGISLLQFIKSICTYLNGPGIKISFVVAANLQNRAFAWNATIHHVLSYSLFKRFSTLNEFLRSVEKTYFVDCRVLFIA